ncbi:MAG: cytidylyltransferase domain-containing protein [Bacteroidota bacterium]
MKTLVIIQARIGSTRLPGKVMLSLAGRPLLERIIERVRAARMEFDLAVATTHDPSDEPIRELCRALGVDCYSGHPTDLLERHYRCAFDRAAHNVVKIPSDCPLIDPDVVDLVLAYYYANYPKYDYVSNLHPPTFPDGNDVEIMKMSVLEEAWQNARQGYEREHTTPYIWERPEKFHLGSVGLSNQNYSVTHRWTIDYEEDYRFISTIYSYLWRKDRPIFKMHDILNLMEENPSLAQINAKFSGISWYRNHLHELKTITPIVTKTG